MLLPPTGSPRPLTRRWDPARKRSGASPSVRERFQLDPSCAAGEESGGGRSEAGRDPASNKPQEAQRRREAPAGGRPRPERALAGFGELPLVLASKVISVPRVGAGAEPPRDAGGERPEPSGAGKRERGATSRPEGAPCVPPAMSTVFPAPGIEGSRPGQCPDPGAGVSAAPVALGVSGSRSERPAARRERAGS